MTYNEETSARVYNLLRRRKGFVGKTMFGGFGYLLDGHMCCGVWRDFLILRVGPSIYAQMLRQPYVRPFDLTGREMRGWIMVEPAGFEDEDDLRRLIDQAATFARSLPPKVPVPSS